MRNLCVGVMALTLIAAAPVWAANEREVADPNAPAVQVTPDPGAPVWDGPEAILYDNGPVVNSVGTGVGGADESILQTVSLSMTTLGFGHQFLTGNRMADDFTVADPAGWDIQTITFFAYQTGSSTTSTMTGIYLQIWDGPPDNPASTVVFGDLVTNRLQSTAWSNAYRVTETTTGSATDRPIMASVATVGTTLPAGTYWVDWMTDGSLASGPWAPPITITGSATTGNAIQFIASGGAWGPALDGGSATQQGMPFIIEGVVVPVELQSFGIE